MQPKTKKILIWSGVGIGAITLAYFIYNAITGSTEKAGGGDDFQGPKDTGGTSGNVPTNNTTSIISGSTCGLIHTDYDHDFDYVRCVANDTVGRAIPIWYTKSKPNGSKPNVYKTWTSLFNNTVATQRLNAKYSNG